MPRSFAQGAALKGRLAVDDASLKDFRKALKQVTTAVRQGVMARAVLDGAEPIRDAANADAPGPHIKKELVKVTNDNAIAAVGPEKSKWYYHFFEFGVSAHEIKGSPLVFYGDVGFVVTSSVNHPGMAADPFLEPATEQKKGEAVERIGSTVKREIERQAAK